MERRDKGLPCLPVTWPGPARRAWHSPKAVYGRTVALCLSVAGLARRGGMTAGESERIEEGGTEPAIPAPAP